MAIKLIPDFGIEQLVGKSFGMDRDAAENQVSLVVEAHNALDDSGDLLERLAEGQTGSIWTEDGKSVPLAAELTAKYTAAIKWRQAIQAELYEAAANLRIAITETTELDEAQQAWYLTRLDSAFGPAASSDSGA